MKSTVICHVFNEEYMLPFWLEHHRRVFDHGIIIDYCSTDASVAIVAAMCPTWTVRTSRNAMFDASETDKEVMEIESTVKGIKMALNVTEFIFPKKPLSSYFTSSGECFRLEALTPVEPGDQSPKTLNGLLAGIMHVAHGVRMGHRFIHTHPTGRYSVGRHTSELKSVDMPDAQLLWMGFYPWNEHVIRRKLQILAQIPSSDVRDRLPILVQHTLSREQLELKKHDLVNAGCGWYKYSICMM